MKCRNLVVLLMAPGLCLLAQTGIEKAQMIEAARMDAYNQLARTIKGLELSDSSLIANHVTQERLVNAVTEAFLQGTVLSEPVFVDDICMINASLTMEQVIENLESVKKKYGIFKEINIENVTRRTSQKVFSAQGVGTLPAPTQEDAKTATDTSGAGLQAALAKLDGPGQSKLAAKEAAFLDACAQLARQINGIHVNSQSLVFNMAQKSSQIEGVASMLVKGAQVKQWTAIDKDLLSCVVTITYQQIVENVETVQKTFAPGFSVSRTNIEQSLGGTRIVTATGYGGVGRGRIDGPVIINH